MSSATRAVPSTRRGGGTKHGAAACRAHVRVSRHTASAAIGQSCHPRGIERGAIGRGSRPRGRECPLCPERARDHARESGASRSRVTLSANRVRRCRSRAITFDRQSVRSRPRVSRSRPRGQDSRLRARQLRGRWPAPRPTEWTLSPDRVTGLSRVPRALDRQSRPLGRQSQHSRWRQHRLVLTHGQVLDKTRLLSGPKISSRNLCDSPCTFAKRCQNESCAS